MRGWACVALRNTDEGLSEISHGVKWAGEEAHFGNTTSLAFQAEAFRLAGLREEALSVLTKILLIMNGDDERLWEANAHILKGLLLFEHFDDRQLEAETCFQDAIEMARTQHAKLWELRATTRLAHLWQSQSKSNEAGDLLGPLYNWFTEEFDTADLKEANALLDELG